MAIFRRVSWKSTGWPQLNGCVSYHKLAFCGGQERGRLLMTPCIYNFLYLCKYIYVTRLYCLAFIIDFFMKARAFWLRYEVKEKFIVSCFPHSVIGWRTCEVRLKQGLAWLWQHPATPSDGIRMCLSLLYHLHVLSLTTKWCVFSDQFIHTLRMLSSWVVSSFHTVESS